MDKSGLTEIQFEAIQDIRRKLEKVKKNIILNHTCPEGQRNEILNHFVVAELHLCSLIIGRDIATPYTDLEEILKAKETANG